MREGWARYQQDTADTQIRDRLTQRFEFTYEISHKMLKRQLEMTSAISSNPAGMAEVIPAGFDEMSFQDLIRSGNENGLLLGQ